MKKILVFLTLCFLAFGFVYSYIEVNYLDKDDSKMEVKNLSKEKKDELKSYGFDNRDIKVIRNNLTEEEINVIKNSNNKEYLMDYIKEDYFKLENLSRYVEYDKNTEYNKKDIVMYVNIGIDTPHYTNVKIIENPYDTLAIVNKYHALPSGIEPQNLVSSNESYNPSGLKMEKIASENLDLLMNEAKNAGYVLYLVSGYRSESYQSGLYNYYVKIDGETKTDTYSARPNHSEHQTGLAADIGICKGCLDGFENTNAYPWVKENAHKYGFIERYPKDKEFITGYMYEPWHYRYVGTEAASTIYNENITFEEYYVKYIEK